MASGIAYTEEQKRIFAKAYAATHNLAKAYRELNPKEMKSSTASQNGRNLLNKLDVQELVQRYEEENQRQSQAQDGCRFLDINERRRALAELIRDNVNSKDYQIANTALKALDILNKMDGVYIEKRQVEINKSLADVIKAVDGDA